MYKYINANLWQIDKYEQKRNKKTRGKLRSVLYGVLLGTMLEQAIILDFY
jgi:hypothetical protein